MSTPKEIIDSTDGEFLAILNYHQSRLSSTYGGDAISMIWSERNDLQREYARRAQTTIDRLSSLHISKAWSDPILANRFESLKVFALGLASIPPERI